MERGKEKENPPLGAPKIQAQTHKATTTDGEIAPRPEVRTVVLSGRRQGRALTHCPRGRLRRGGAGKEGGARPWDVPSPKASTPHLEVDFPI